MTYGQFHEKVDMHMKFWKRCKTQISVIKLQLGHGVFRICLYNLNRFTFGGAIAFQSCLWWTDIFTPIFQKIYNLVGGPWHWVHLKFLWLKLDHKASRNQRWIQNFSITDVFEMVTHSESCVFSVIPLHKKDKKFCWKKKPWPKFKILHILCFDLILD